MHSQIHTTLESHRHTTQHSSPPTTATPHNRRRLLTVRHRRQTISRITYRHDTKATDSTANALLVTTRAFAHQPVHIPSSPKSLLEIPPLHTCGPKLRNKYLPHTRHKNHTPHTRHKTNYRYPSHTSVITNTHHTSHNKHTPHAS